MYCIIIIVTLCTLFILLLYMYSMMLSISARSPSILPATAAILCDAMRACTANNNRAPIRTCNMADGSNLLLLAS